MGGVCLFCMFFIPFGVWNWAGLQTSAPAGRVRILPRDAGWKFSRKPGHGRGSRRGHPGSAPRSAEVSPWGAHPVAVVGREESDPLCSP